MPGASVFIDRVYLGTTPVTAEGVVPGTHRLNVSVEGYDGIAETIEVAPGPKDIEIKFKEVRLDATIEVVHKHGVGSCRGTLHATPRGVTFAASDAGDRFD
ncbi:MAG TPA: PEGA domain-containing protein, partial [Vicinamibacterales bacterium]|nr:PEGA domain-containing protein [Vicinamibacterales bacterium]